MANKRIRDLDDGAANLTTTDSLAVDRTALDEAERVTVQNVIDKPTDVSGSGWVLDEDTMSSDSATKVPTQQSVKAYVDTNTIGNVVEDTTPQLGGSLDVNGNEITGAIDLHSTGDIIAELGDAAGTNKLSVRDSAGTEQAAIDSDGNITTNGTVDGIDIATDVAANTAKVTNATHTGDVTGSGALTIDPTAISGKTLVTAVSGDMVLLWDATDSAIKRADVSDFGGGGGLNNVVEDTTPQLGGQLDVNGNAIGDGTRELLTFVEDASAVNHIELENQATGSGPILRATGDDTNVDLNLEAKGSGSLLFETNTVWHAGNDGTGSGLDADTVDGVEAASLLQNVVEDTTPQLGGQLDVNGNGLGDGTLELLTFTETGSAVNHVNITNAATGNGPTVSAVGDDTNVDLLLAGKGSGVPKIGANTIATLADTLDEFGNPAADIDMADFGLLQVANVERKVQTVSATGATETLDNSLYGVFDMTMDANCTFTFSNPAASGEQSSFVLYLRQDATGGRTATLPASVDWHGGTAPTLTTTANADDVLAFHTVDGGTTWLGFALALDIK